jgi:hypothetical protein
MAVALRFLSTDVAVMIALPLDTPVTMPFITEATDGALLVQITAGFVALTGNTFAVIVTRFPIRIVLETGVS